MKIKYLLLFLLVATSILPLLAIIPINTNRTEIIPETAISTATGESMSTAIEIIGLSYTDVRRFQANTYFKVWVEAGVYLSIDVSNGFGDYAVITNSSKRYVENTTQGYYIIKVPQYASGYPQLNFQFTNYTVYIYKQAIHTIQLATEIISGETDITFSSNHYHTRYYKIVVPASKYFAVAPSTMTAIKIYDENLTLLASPSSANFVTEILSTSYSGYYYISIDRPVALTALTMTGVSEDFKLNVIIENPVSMASAEEILTSTTSITLGNYFTKYIKINLPANSFFWLQYSVSSAIMQQINVSMGIGYTFILNTSSYPAKGPGYYFIGIIKMNKTLTTLPIKIVTGAAIDSTSATTVTPGIYLEAFPFDGKYPVKYYKINVADGKYLGVLTNTSMVNLMAMISDVYPLSIVENTTNTPSTEYFVMVGLSEISSNWYYEGGVQINFTVDTAYSREDATTITSGVTHVKLPTNGVYPYVYYKISVPATKYLSIEINNPMLDFSVYDAGGSPLFTGDLWSYSEPSTTGGLYYIRVGMGSFMGIGAFWPSLLIAECDLTIKIEPPSTGAVDIITVGNTSGTVDPYGSKDYQIYLLPNKYFSVEIVPTSANSSFAFEFSTQDGSCSRMFESFNLPLKETFYITTTGYHNLTILGRGSYTLVLTLTDTKPNPPHSMPLSINHWAKYLVQGDASILGGIFTAMAAGATPISTGQVTFEITNIDYYGGNYILNNTYYPSTILLPSFLTSPPFLPLDYEMNPMGYSFNPFGSYTPIDFRRYQSSIFNIERGLGTYTYKETILDTDVYTFKVSGISTITASYDKLTGVLLSIECSNIIVQDFGISSYSVTLLDTNITLTGKPAGGGIPGFAWIFTVLSLIGLGFISFLRIKVKIDK